MLHHIIVSFEERPSILGFVNTEEFHFDDDQLVAFMSGMWWLAITQLPNGDKCASVTAYGADGTILKDLAYMGGYGPSEVK